MQLVPAADPDISWENGPGLVSGRPRLCPEHRAWMSSAWCSADALRDRGVLMIDHDSSAADGSELAVPVNPRMPYGARPAARARRAKAQEPIERLVTEGRFRMTDLDDDEVAEWRRVVRPPGVRDAAWVWGGRRRSTPAVAGRG
ncbi:hypothetical protein ACFWVP_05635 [Streptomyces sp. NPDC058637]|uniref:hypothetical protein n=1 Tax=Streptomyces sp. NPDC058637 TaxID=3346569 RepID=UPI00364C3804